jgi:hypothetical protein
MQDDLEAKIAGFKDQFTEAMSLSETETQLKIAIPILVAIRAKVQESGGKNLEEIREKIA